jgi:alpha-L-fucosidase
MAWLIFLLFSIATSVPLPVPSQTQLDFLRNGPTQFMHFGMCTFHGCQQNSPYQPASSFNPTFADTDQWARVARSWGAARICLTVHHTGGFALWPTKVYNYSIAQSPYQNGTGDIVRDFVASCRKYELEPCFYIIPSWDNFVTTNFPGYDAAQYLQVQLDMLTELLSNYGPIGRSLLFHEFLMSPAPRLPLLSISLFVLHFSSPLILLLFLTSRIWFDNYMLDTTSCQPAPNHPPGFEQPNLTATWETIIGHVKQISPNTFLLPGPDGCLNPGEAGDGVYPTWNYQRGPAVYWGCANAPPPSANASEGFFFAPHESVISVLNPGDFFFWDASDPILPASVLFSHYTLAVGQGSNFNLNVPPDRTGAIPEDIVREVAGLGAIIAETYTTPVASAAGLPRSAPCPELVVSLELPVGAAWDQTVLVEDLAPQMIKAYRIEYLNASGTWLPVGGVHGGTVGARVVDWGLAPVAALHPSALRFVCEASLDDTLPATVTLFAAYLGAPMK